MRVKPSAKKSFDVRALLANTLLGQLGEEVLDEAVACARIERYARPTLLNAAGQPLERLRLVVSGRLQLLARHASGTEVVLTDMGPGAWATWIPVLTHKPPDHELHSGTSTVLLSLPSARVRELCQKHPALYPMILQEVGDRLRLLMAWTSQSILLEPEQRMASLIALVAQEQKCAGNSVGLQITQSRLASLARCSRQSANLLLGALEARGLIVLSYRTCTIPDLERLRAFAAAEQRPGLPCNA